MKPAFRYIVFLTMICLLTVEIGLRISGAYKTYSERNGGRYTSEYGRKVSRYFTRDPNRNFTLEQPEFSIHYTVNSLGYRERELPDEARGPQSIRLFAFGDSFTEGVGAEYDSSWPRNLERILTDNGLNAEVYNLGVSGSDPFFNLIDLKERLLIYDPSHVLFAVNSSDLNDAMNRGGMERFADGKWVRYPRAPWFQFLFRYSHIARYFIIEKAGYDFNLVNKKDFERRTSQGLDRLNECLQDAYALCSENQIRFHAVIHPFPNELCSGTEMEWPMLNAIEERLSGLPLILAGPHMEKLLKGTDCSSIYWPVDQHYNSAGYRLMAESIFLAVSEYDPDFWETPAAYPVSD